MLRWCFGALSPRAAAWTIAGVLSATQALAQATGAGAVAKRAESGPRPDAVPAALDHKLGEQLLTLPDQGPDRPALELTLYKPPGPGPFPVVVINHGRDRGSALLQPRYRPAVAAREFVRRGYLVAVPMRPGFSRSAGGAAIVDCQVQADTLRQARAVRQALDWLGQQPYADVSRNLVAGQSQGGLVTLAYGAAPHPGTRLLLNFAGGLRLDGCADWPRRVAQAMAEFGRSTRLPSLWFYGDNDSYFKPSFWRTAFAEYQGATAAAGGHAELVAYGDFDDDAHTMFGDALGVPIWLPKVLAAMRAQGLPISPPDGAPLDGAAELADIPPPPESRYARLFELAKLPVATEAGRQGYREWLAQPGPKAFAVHPESGGWAATWGGERPYARALAACQRHSNNQACKLYAVDNTVVWSPE